MGPLQRLTIELIILISFNLWRSQKVRYYGLRRREGREKGRAGCFGPAQFACTNFMTRRLHKLTRVNLLFKNFMNTWSQQEQQQQQQELHESFVNRLRM